MLVCISPPNILPFQCINIFNVSFNKGNDEIKEGEKCIAGKTLQELFKSSFNIFPPYLIVYALHDINQ